MNSNLSRNILNIQLLPYLFVLPVEKSKKKTKMPLFVSECWAWMHPNWFEMLVEIEFHTPNTECTDENKWKCVNEFSALCQIEQIKSILSFRCNNIRSLKIADLKTLNAVHEPSSDGARLPLKNDREWIQWFYGWINLICDKKNSNIINCFPSALEIDWSCNACMNNNDFSLLG